MGAFDARHVHEAGIAANQHASRETQLRHRLIATLGQCAGAISESLAALEDGAHLRMGLESLEFLEWREIGIGIVEVQDEPDRHQIVVEMIEE